MKLGQKIKGGLRTGLKVASIGVGGYLGVKAGAHLRDNRADSKAIRDLYASQKERTQG
tara:strand:+ start:514 stop:687 length:174 start_codon:yes stop_codon:yes gene_type:complete